MAADIKILYVWHPIVMYKQTMDWKAVNHNCVICWRMVKWTCFGLDRKLSSDIIKYLRNKCLHTTLYVFLHNCDLNYTVLYTSQRPKPTEGKREYILLKYIEIVFRVFQIERSLCNGEAWREAISN